MAQLSSVISSILRDYITAQHEANCYVQALAHDYAKDGKLRNFRMPQAMIDGLELDLKYVVQNTGEMKENLLIDYKELYRFLEKDLTPQIAQTAITIVVLAVNDGTSKTAGEFRSILDKGEKLRTEFGAFLSRKINEELRTDIDCLLTDNGNIIPEKVLDKTIKVVFKEFLQHPDLAGTMDGETGEALKAELQKKLQNGLSGLTARLLKGFSALRKEMQTTIEITMIADDLKEYPSEMVQSLRFKIGNESMDMPVAEDMSK